jgi:glycerophosphoryl diester phosphodiesterase
MLILAHRGANRLAPENTVAAMTRALELGADGVELDVHRTADHQLVVRHDAASAAGILCDLSLAEIRSALPGVPTLAEVLDACRGGVVNVEIKNLPGDPDWDPDERAVDLLAELLEGRAGTDDVIVSSFHLPTVDRMRVRAPLVPTGFLTFGLAPLEGLATADAHGHQALHPDVWSLGGPVLDALTEEARERGLRVNVWTVNDRHELRRLEAAGVDAVITDDSELFAGGEGVRPPGASPG